MPVNPMYQYRIQWKSKLTQYEHYGSWFYINQKNYLEEEIIRLNKEFKDIKHWLVTKNK